MLLQSGITVSSKVHTQVLVHILSVIHYTVNQSIKIYFLSNRNITMYTVYASAQKAAREAYAH